MSAPASSSSAPPPPPASASASWVAVTESQLVARDVPLRFGDNHSRAPAVKRVRSSFSSSSSLLLALLEVLVSPTLVVPLDVSQLELAQSDGRKELAQVVRALEAQQLVRVAGDPRLVITHVDVRGVRALHPDALRPHRVKLRRAMARDEAKAAAVTTALAPFSSSSSSSYSPASPSKADAEEKKEEGRRPATAGKISLFRPIELTGGAEGRVMARRERVPETVMDLLNRQSVEERRLSHVGREIEELINAPTAKDKLQLERFRSAGSSLAVLNYCPHLTAERCCRARKAWHACELVHFLRILLPHTDPKLGDCSYLDACRHEKSCKFVHYEIDPASIRVPPWLRPQHQAQRYISKMPPQWINCDVRKFKLEILGDFPVIMADPPWMIHQDLPYGTMSDQEMLDLGIPKLQREGVIFLWVTGRAQDLGRQCLEKWGYRPAGELLWVKTNQVQCLIRTGRTGHWLNHSKEHCLLGIKGNPAINRNLDADVVVAEVRETSRKPDEMYALLERLAPGARKLEIFGRPHNVYPGWMTLGNQLGRSHLADAALIERFKAEYPDRPVHHVMRRLERETFLVGLRCHAGRHSALQRVCMTSDIFDDRVVPGMIFDFLDPVNE